MALLFSAVRATANDQEVEFFVGGIPREYDDLEGWTAFDRFMGEIDKETEVAVHAESYLYGEEETYRATPEEVAYFMKRIEMDDTFLSRCDNIESVDFTIIWVSCYGRYFRCIRTKFTNLEYKNTLKEYKSHEGWTWGFPHQLEYEPPITENRLFVVEKIFRNKVETINDRNNLINNPDPKFGSVLDDLFGDG